MRYTASHFFVAMYHSVSAMYRRAVDVFTGL